MVASDSCNSRHCENYEKDFDIFVQELKTFHKMAYKTLKFGWEIALQSCPKLVKSSQRTYFQYRIRQKNGIWKKFAYFLFTFYFATNIPDLQIKFKSTSFDSFFNPLSAGAFFWAFFQKISKIWLCNAISQEWINQNTKFCIPFCSKFYPLSKYLRTFFMILPVEGATAPASRPCQMTNIFVIGS